MIDHATFYERRDKFCQVCDWWKGACLKGHSLASPQGCPIQKFPPVEGADYAPDKPTTNDAPQVVQDCCGPGNADLPPMTWPSVLVSFAQSMVKWVAEGLPLADAEKHGARYDQCKLCPQFHRFYCKHCRCVSYLKTKLLSERCPLEPPKWV